MLAIAVGVLSFVIILFALYAVSLQLQLRNINQQLTRRLTEHTRQPVNLELINRQLNTLAVNINKCLESEETLRINVTREEKNFKEMIANISHDLRTPLTAIKGYQQLMAKGMLTDDQRQKLQIAQKHADELGNLIEHFFEYSYYATAEPKLNIEKLNLTNLVAECLADAVNIFEEHNLTVCMEKAPPVYVSADKEMTVRIIQNLIRNCAQHSAGTVEVRVLAAESAIVSFKNPVSDAIKIDPQHLFDRFYTGDRARHSTTGLGLAIVKLLTEQMGGSVGATLRDGSLEISIKLPVMKKQYEKNQSNKNLKQ